MRRKESPMSSEIDVRSERPGDEDAIDAVVCRAFRSMHEANLVRAGGEGR